ncbi:hypothetical protein [Conexivisphaera calida]|uniref:Integral membrane protein n=1 Tax=Conexivisphaera calida TaxID=1874277 RepID=A0A4P2VCN6_9ARCH|nr:hypothetical protein [Conexivisphaera calida]BBE41891.1 hypothetical protein NAS2_0502 [Conexivisphaera calida]
MERDRQTVNVLVLELATMIVAIALAFNAQTLSTSHVEPFELIGFIIVNLIVIWFWWSYIMDRLEFPPATRRFPALDVLVLVLISLIPYVLKEANAIYTSGLLSALMFVWSFMMREIISENAAALEPSRLRGLRRGMYIRAIAGLVFAASSALSFVNTLYGRAAFAATVFVVFLQIALSRLAPSRRARRSRI